MAPSVITSVAVTVAAILKAVAKTVVTFDRHEALFRSAVMLIVFLVSHALGNLTYFWGSGVMNRYGEMLTSNPLILIIEYYLALAFVVHVLTAAYGTLRDGRLKAKWTWRSLKLALTGSLLLVFVLVHLKTFKFGPHYKMVTHDRQVIRDIHRLVREHFADPWYTAFYVLSMAALLLHLQGGWKRTVLRLGLSKPRRVHAKAIGNIMALAVCGIFVAVTAYAHFNS